MFIRLFYLLFIFTVDEMPFEFSLKNIPVLSQHLYKLILGEREKKS